MQESKDNPTLQRIKAYLRQSIIDWQGLLTDVVSYFDCTTGTLHFLDESSALLKLKAQLNIPTFLLPKVSTIPVGKGMAGIAAQRREPVEMCNLQTDESGVARPAAKETKVEGSIVVPMIWEKTLYGTLGVAKPVPYDFTEVEITDLMEIGAAIGHTIAEQQ